MVEDLENEIHDSTVTVSPDSEATIIGDFGTVVLDARQCQVLFHSRHAVTCLYETLGSPKSAAITLHELGIMADVMDALERRFSAIDET